MFRVKFVDMVEQTIVKHDYDNLWAALSVAKNTDIGPDRINRVAITDAVFNEQLHTLLTSGFIYTGIKTTEHPDGNFMVMLLKINDKEEERPVYNSPLYFFDNLPATEEEEPKFPLVNQRIKDGEPTTNSITESYTIMKLINPEKIHRTEPGAGNYS